MSSTPRTSAWDREGVLASIIGRVPLPRMAPVRQSFPDGRLPDLAGAVAAELARPEIAATVRPGMRIAVAVGSRGIDRLPLVIGELVRGLRRAGAEPFVFPAMGSHGGATAEGQLGLLAALGVTEESVGAPVRSSMETLVVGRAPRGQEVHVDRLAAEADGIVAVGRVKPHTAFRGPYESGIMKMLAIGMGKRRGAEICHAEGFGRMAENVAAFGRVVLERTKLLFGLALVENAYDAACLVEALPRGRIEEREPELLALAKSRMPRILLPEFDLLVVDRIGKNFSGDGADPNVTGTYCTPYASGGPRFERYAILDLSDETHGNCLGVGMADFTTERLFAKADFGACYTNALTSRVVMHAKLPVVLPSDRLALQAALYSCVGADPAAPRVVRIPDTSHLGLISVSEALLPEVARSPGMEAAGMPAELEFDESGDLW
ncbi:MAG TPA: lactate racemase domain-containing protein [Spirochaetia bacterium]|nr:lactate racemase domain-containing protein [Spirochaetia bacterium]HRZ65578.1 lactate racemase domain-containing protein [Spirochaetia bacterium]